MYKPILQLADEAQQLIIDSGMEYHEAIKKVVDTEPLGDFKTIGEVYLCRKRLISQVNAELEPQWGQR